MLLFIVVFVTIFVLFFVCEFIMIKNDIAMPNMIRYIFGVSFILFTLSTILYFIGSKIFKYNIPDFILTNTIEIFALVIIAFIISIVLLIK